MADTMRYNCFNKRLIASLLLACIILSAFLWIVISKFTFTRKHHIMNLNPNVNHNIKKDNEPLFKRDCFFTFRDAKILLYRTGWTSSTKIPQDEMILASSIEFDGAALADAISIEYVWLVPDSSIVKTFIAGENSVGYNIQYPESYCIKLNSEKKEIHLNCYIKPLKIAIADNPEDAKQVLEIREKAINHYAVVPIQKAIQINYKTGVHKYYYTAHYILVLFKKKEDREK